MLDYILQLIYPNVCGFCDTICKESLCEKCEEHLKDTLLCKIDNYENDNSKYFSNHLYLFKYDSEIRQKILEYKFNDKAYLYKTFAKIIIKNRKICGFLEKCDIIIPVPIHKKRLNERGYNQSELISKEIVNNIKRIKLLTNVLIKVQNTKPQSTLNKEQRIENAKNAYAIKNSEKIKNKNIILVDDIYTTGSTANECSKLLKFAGAKEINIFTLAKD